MNTNFSTELVWFVVVLVSELVRVVLSLVTFVLSICIGESPGYKIQLQATENSLKILKLEV